MKHTFRISFEWRYRTRANEDPETVRKGIETLWKNWLGDNASGLSVELVQAQAVHND